jgi:hypothetical protein
MSDAECVRAISAAGHRKKKAFSGKIIDIVTQFHLRWIGQEPSDRLNTNLDIYADRDMAGLGKNLVQGFAT